MLDFLRPGYQATEKAAQPTTIVKALADDASQRAAVLELKNRTTVADGIGATAVQGYIGTIHRALQSAGYEPEAGFVIPTDREKRWKDLGLPTEQWELFGRAVSTEHLSHLESIALQNTMAQRDMAQFSTPGQIALGMTDPVAFAIDAASGGLGYVAKAGRIANAARAGAVAAAANTTMAGLSATFNPSVTVEDMALTAGASFALAGVIGARRGQLLEEAVNPAKVKALVRDESLSAAKVEGLAVDPIPGAPPLREETAKEQEWLDQALGNAHIRPAFADIRRDLSALMGTSAAPEVREAGRALFRDGVGYSDRSIAVKESTTEFAKRHTATLETEWRASTNAAWTTHRKAHDIRWWDYPARARFNEEVGRAVRGAADVSPEAQQGAAAVAAVTRKALKLAQEAGLDGFDNLASNPNYLPRYFSASGFRALFGEHGLEFDQVVDGVLKPAMRKRWTADGAGSPDEELLDAVARAYLRRAQANFEGGAEAIGIRPLDPDDVASIADLLKDAGVDPAKSAGILGRLGARTADAGKIDRAKHRIDMDENFEATLVNARGEGVIVRVSDLFDNDVDQVMARYTREVAGWSALSSKLGVSNRTQLDRYRAQVEDAAFKAGGKDHRDAITRMLDIGINSTLGKSTEVDPAGKASRYGRFLRQYNFSRVMNQVGFSLFAELGPTVAHSGLRNFMESTAFVRGFIRRGADGKLVAKDAQLIEELFAPGSDHLRNPPFMRLEDDAIVPPTFGDTRFGRSADNVMMGANHVTSIMSGMAPINTMLQRIAGRATLLRLLDLANAQKLSGAETARLRNWGLTEKDQSALFAALKGKRRIADISPSELDFATRERMAAFLFRVTRHQITESDPSDSLALMHSVGGKLVFQFRTFMVNSYVRHFLNSARHLDDWRTYAMIVLSTSAAGMGWAARTYLNTIGDEEARRKQLTVENFRRNAVAQSSWSSIVPAITDMVWTDVLRNDPVFRYNRSTGLENGVQGIPTLDLGLKAYGSLGLLGTALQDDQKITEKQMRDFWKVLFFNNMTGVRNVADEAFEHVPE